MSFTKTIKGKLVPLFLCLAIISCCLVTLFWHYRNPASKVGGLISLMENKILDLRFTIRGPLKPTGKIGILAIDEKSLQKFGRFPFSRKYYERAFANLKIAGANWIGFDVVWNMQEQPLLSEIDSNLERLATLNSKTSGKALQAELLEIAQIKKNSAADQSLGNMIKDYEKIVLGYFYLGRHESISLGEDKFKGLEPMSASAIENVVLPEEKIIDDYPELMTHGLIANTDFLAGQTENFAFFNNKPDPDGVVRWTTLVKNVGGYLMPSLSLKLANEILGREMIVFFEETGELGIKEISLLNPDDDEDLRSIPIDHRGYGRILLNHLGPGFTLRHVSLADAYDDSFSEEERKAIRGMNFILGPTAIGINDQRTNPFDAGINGVENHAAVVDNIISERYMRRLPTIYQTELWIVLTIGLLFTPLMLFGSALFSGMAALLFIGGYITFDYFFWFGQGEWVYMGMPAIEIISLFVGTTLYKYMTEERERKKVKGALAHYISPEVMHKVLDHPENLKLGGEKKELTIFFSDVRGFTSISESLSPEKLCEFMNDYFNPMEAIIKQTGGVVDKYIGDAIMAFWGAPVEVQNQADIAAIAAISMLYELDKLKADFLARGFPDIDIGIGLNTDTVSVGNMGSTDRFQYTVMGDGVNLASRLEGQTKTYGIKILIGENTQRKLTRKEILTRDLDDIRVKGKKIPIKVFEVMRPDYLPNHQLIIDLISEFHAGRESYRTQDWKKAEQHFLKCLELKPDDGPTKLYINRIDDRKQQPFEEGWDGVFVAKTK